MPDLARRYPITPHPWGWFAVALSHELRAGDVLRLEVLGRDLVAFRTASGQVAVVEAYCPHLGADLGAGALDGDLLVCPFHHWAWTVDGRCAAVPNAARLPASARLRAFATVERNGVVLFWHGPEAEPRPWFEAPELPQEGWSPARFTELVLEMHIVEVAENGVDIAHFPTIHRCERSGATLLDAQATPFRFELRTMYPGDGIGVPGTRVAVTTDWSYWGPGLFVGVSTADDFGTRVRHVFHFTPTTDDRLHFRIAIQADTTTVPADLVAVVQEHNEEMSLANLLEDAPIWKTKRYVPRAALSDADGPIGPLRRWLRPFYAATATPPLTAEEAAAAEEPERRDYGAPAGARAVPSGAAPPAPRSATAVDAAAVKSSIVDGLPASFDAEAAGEEPFAIQYDILGSGGGKWYVEVGDRRCRVSDGEGASARVRVTVSAADWLALHLGRLDRTRAFLTGRLKVSGDFALARRLDRIFPHRVV